jgi:PAS domain S-box-containing protein
MNLNRRLAQLNGRPLEEHLGRTVQEMIPELYSQVEPYIRRALRGEAILGVEITKPSSSPNGGQTILLTYEPARDEAGEVVGVSVAIVDLTPVKKAEQARHESEAHFRHMIELLPQIPWIIDSEGRALDVSQRWLEISGMTDDQWRGFGWLSALHPDDVEPTQQAMRTAFATGEPIDVVYRVRRSEGDPWKPMRSRGAARVGADGKIVGWYGCLEPAEENSQQLA